MKKTLLVGIDAACWKFLNPLLEAGQLPHLQRLKREGCWGNLHSTMPPITPAAWSSIVTGKKPIKHGVFDFVRRAADSYEVEPVTARDRLGTPFWSRLNDAGVRVGLVNVPLSHPVGALDGFFVGGFGCPNNVADTTFPESLLDRIEKSIGEPYRPTVEVARQASPQELFQADWKQQEQHVAIIEALLSDHPVEVLVVNLMLYDHANHYMPDDSWVEKALRQTDIHLGKILEVFEPSCVLAISDHGSERVCGTFLCFDWLRDHGFTASQSRSSDGQAAALNWVLMEWLSTIPGLKGSPEKVLRSVLREGLPRLPGRFSSLFWERLESVVPRAREHVRWKRELDHPATRVYSLPSANGLLFVNLRGREPKGSVSAEDRSRLVEEAVRCLQSATVPGGNQPVLTHVEAFDLSEAQVAAGWPDIAVFSESPWKVCLAPFEARVTKARNRYFVEERLGWFGKHAYDGIYIFRGEEFQSGPGQNAAVWDVPATLLYLYDVPIPEDFDGEIMRGALSRSMLDRQGVRRQPGDPLGALPMNQGTPPGASEELLGRLRALGYLK